MADLTQPEDLARLRAGMPASNEGPSIEVMLSAAARAIRAQSYETARDILEGAVLLDPDEASAWSMLGLSHDKLGAAEPAIRAYERALSLDDDDPTTALALALVYLRKKNVDKALSWLTWMVATFDDATPAVREAERLRRELLETRGGAS